MFKIARFLKNYKKQVILGTIFKLIEAIFKLIVPIIMAKIIDIGIANKDIIYIINMGLLLIFIGVICLCSSLICQCFAAFASQGFYTTLRNELFSHINTFSYKEVDKFGTPSLITRVINDVNKTCNKEATEKLLFFSGLYILCTLFIYLNLIRHIKENNKSKMS